jgi:hypothetical protein
VSLKIFRVRPNARREKTTPQEVTVDYRTSNLNSRIEYKNQNINIGLEENK